ncbi:MAG: ATP-binding protein [bacterium]
MKNNASKKYYKYVVIRHIISLILIGLYFTMHLYSKDLNILLLAVIALFIILIIFYLSMYNYKKVSTNKTKDKYILSILYTALISFIIFHNGTIDTIFIKFFYLLPIIIFSAEYGKKVALFTSAFTVVNLLLVSFLNRDLLNPELDFLLIILFFWIAWLIGGFIDLERKAKEKLYNMTKELENVNKELRNSQELFKVNLEKSNIGMVISDIKGNIIKSNEAFNTMMAFEENELQDQNLYMLRKNANKNDCNICKKMLKNNIKALTTETEYLNKYGGTISIKQNTSIAYDNEKKPLYFLNQMENITEKKLVEARYKEQKEELEYNILKTRFFSKLSHELKTPINLILSSLQILNKKYNKTHQIDSNKQIKKYFDIIKQNSYRLLRLVNNIIDLSKIDSNSFQINLENKDIVSIIREIVFSTEEYVLNNNRKFKFKSTLKEKYMACDAFSIERIILNLISNAVKFTDENDLIEVNLFEKDNNLIIKVSDTGIGIKEEKLKLIFEYFRQVDESFSRRAEGSGIGLSIVKSLTELHNGTIWAKSTYGEGSSFYVSLPIYVLPENQNNKNGDIYKNLIDKVEVEFSDIYK